MIDRTTARSYVTIPTGWPDCWSLLKPFRDELRLVNERGDIEIGPIPKGVPVNLVANIDLRPDRMGLLDRVQHDAKLAKLLVAAIRDLRSMPEDASDEEARGIRQPGRAHARAQQVPDFVVNRGHYFGTDRFAEEPGWATGKSST